jgi:predicted transglutaminase-like cysteine proteinase
MNRFKAIICSISFSFTAQATPSTFLDLEVRKVVDQRESYTDFCHRFPKECEFKNIEVFKNSNYQEVMDLLNQINLEVNDEISFTLDTQQYDREEYWTLPLEGFGDCEDNALEKRRRLVQKGIPRGALSMTTAFHRGQYYAHALLLVETVFGTYVLDQDADQVVHWSEAPYIYEARELPLGKWEYYYQDW